MKHKKLNYYNIEKLANSVKIEFLQPFTIENLHYFDMLKPFEKTFKGYSSIILDFSNVEDFDTSLILFLNEINFWASKNQISLEIKGQSEKMKSFCEKFANFKLSKPELDKEYSHFFEYFSSIGERIKNILFDYILFFEFFGEILNKLLLTLFQPKKTRWEDFPILFLKNGVNALPIVSLILLLIGIISGYQGAIQLKQFGADIYIADLIGVSITRELGPLMTAILVAGRSGSAFAAEIGTMKVSEEIDALRAMGFDPTRFLVIPRVFAVTLSIPLLVVFGNLAGIIGGLISGLAILDITTTGYFTQLQIAVDLGDVLSGLLKSLIFGFLVASIGCFRGFQVKGGAEGVGSATTISVVSGIFAIIIADTLFTFIFDAIGL
ncbi:MAG: ABC transporter permease [Ignavibacteria bacterium]|nr:ABC transporter permease [Ignavibacteria bacterium]